MITVLRAGADEVPGDDGWLLPAERAVLRGLHVPKRRAEWRLGRWAAKRAVAGVLNVDPRAVEVRAADDGAPEARNAEGRLLPVALSLSHRDGVAVCAVVAPPRPLGCDVESVESRAPAFARTWFTGSEQAAVAAADPPQRDLLVTVLWSAKESVLKLRRSGLREDPRGIEVAVDDDAQTAGVWHPLRTGGGCEGRWRVDAGLVTTVVAGPAG